MKGKIITGVCALLLVVASWITGTLMERDNAHDIYWQGANDAMESAYLIESSDHHYGIAYFDMEWEWYYAQ